ncbi:MAG: acyl-CoA reductase, partial [Bacteroidota bacterium]|nr:acyl-CoA reductase [Bacteroidota bacterium]
SRIGSVHFQFYQEMSEVMEFLSERKEDIQCVVSKSSIVGWEYIPFGQSQQPTLDQYADGVDTMQFLTSI